VGDAALRAVALLPSLGSLNLCGCKRLSDAGLSALAQATRLTEVNLAHSSVGDVAPLRALPSLRRLNVLGCRLAEPVAGQSESSARHGGALAFAP
jgi:hypothetical protein